MTVDPAGALYSIVLAMPVSTFTPPTATLVLPAKVAGKKKLPCASVTTPVSVRTALPSTIVSAKIRAPRTKPSATTPRDNVNEPASLPAASCTATASFPEEGSV